MTKTSRFAMSLCCVVGMLAVCFAVPATASAQARRTAPAARSANPAEVRLAQLVNQLNQLNRQAAATRAAAAQRAAQGMGGNPASILGGTGTTPQITYSGTSGNYASVLGGTGTTAHITHSGTPGVVGNPAAIVGGVPATPTAPYTVYSVLADRARANPALASQLAELDAYFNQRHDTSIKVDTLGTYRRVPVR